MLYRVGQYNKGIVCDFCMAICEDEFEYYSINSIKVKVDSGISATSKENYNFNIDLCPDCYGKLMEHCSKYIMKVVPAGKIKCDFSDNLYSGKFDYFKITLDKVTVSKAKYELDQKAIVSVDTAIMDFTVGSDVMAGFEKKVANTKEKWAEENRAKKWE